MRTNESQWLALQSQIAHTLNGEGCVDSRHLAEKVVQAIQSCTSLAWPAASAEPVAFVFSDALEFNGIESMLVNLFAPDAPIGAQIPLYAAPQAPQATHTGQHLYEIFRECGDKHGLKIVEWSERDDEDQALWALFGTRVFSAATQALVEPQWLPIEAAPNNEVADFWVIPKPAEECPTDTSGNPITSNHLPFRYTGRLKTWSSLSKATHWMPLPAAPSAGEG